MSISEIFLQSLPLVFLLAVIVGVHKYFQGKRLRKFRRSGMHRVDEMDEQEFSRFLEELFTRLGYRIEKSGPSGGGSAVLLLTRQGKSTAVFGLRTNRKLGLLEVQEVRSARTRFDCDFGIVVTNSTFNYPAQAVADKESIELWDRNLLAETMLDAGMSEQEFSQKDE
ncbi:MAG: restriction endonuclease [Desulfovibrionales bacterium]